MVMIYEITYKLVLVGNIIAALHAHGRYSMIAALYAYAYGEDKKLFEFESMPYMCMDGILTVLILTKQLIS